MKKVYQIALAFPHELGTVNGLYKGILEYAQDFPHFTFRHTGPHDVNGANQLANWKGDGAIASLNSPEKLEMVHSLNYPVVNISSALDDAEIPKVIIDHFEIGKVAAEHLASTGVSSFGFIGLKNRWYSKCKSDGFSSFLKNTGFPVHKILVDKIDDLESEEKALVTIREWLEKISVPIGLFLDTDGLYGIVSEICKEKHWSIPGDIPVIGVNNFSAICLTRTPTLSSIHFGDTRYGYLAMKMLHNLIVDPKTNKSEEIIIHSHKLFARDSTSTTFVSNPKLNAAIKFIRANLSTFFSMEDVIAVTGCSRRWLETAFKTHLETTPASFIQSLRIQKAKQLISDYPKLGLHEIARSCGFSSKRHMEDVFRKAEYINPSEL